MGASATPNLLLGREHLQTAQRAARSPATFLGTMLVRELSQGRILLLERFIAFACPSLTVRRCATVVPGALLVLRFGPIRGQRSHDRRPRVSGRSHAFAGPPVT